MDNLPTRNQNPGDLKDPTTGGFRSFSSPQDGRAALLNDLTAKITGTSTTGLNGSSSLAEFAKVYAPPGDNNNSAQYTANLANKLGVSPDTKIGSLTNRIGDFADAISSNEGYRENVKTHQANITPQVSSNHQPFSEGEISPVAIEDPNAAGNVIKDIGQGNYSGALQSGIKNVGNATGITQLGEGLGGELAKGYEKTKGLLGGQNNSKYLEKTDNVGNILQGGAKVSRTIGTIAGAGAGLLGILGRGAGALVTPTIIDSLPSGLSKEAFLNLGKTEQLNILGDMARTAGKVGMLGDNAEIAKAIQYLLPPEKASLVAKLLKGAWSTAKNLALTKLLGDSVGGFIHRNTGS